MMKMFSKNQCISKLSPCALGCAFAVVKAIGAMMFVCCAARGVETTSAMMNYPVIRSLMTAFYGESLSHAESVWAKVLVGGVVGLVVGFICGVLVAWIYNRVICCCCCKDKSCDVHAGNGNKGSKAKE